MKTLFGRIHFGRLPSEQQRHKDLLKQIRKIMPTLNEAIAQMKEANAQLEVANATIAEVKPIIVKVGTETDKLKQIIDNLPPVGDAPAELVAEIEKMRAIAGNLVTLSGEAKTEIGIVDAKVDD